LLKEINLYVKCQNIEGEKNEHDFKINICVDDGPDRTPPAVYPETFLPASGSFVAFNATEKTIPNKKIKL
jgi:hypothetical protein